MAATQRLGAVIAAAPIAGSAGAGPVTGFVVAFGKVDVSYHTALLMTNSGNAQKSETSLAAFGQG
ncbi:hypothetical protein [Maliponia aquimaris]|uniref:hypothetical protein n=1 Tax=Maliponia aquimaris TaxID=1673631 RepID=UPI000B8A8281|nr:hypothetical protein [Maliponia aquimaris]